MEKLKSIFSIISGIIFLLSGVLLFSCQENSRVEERTIVKGDTTITITKEVNTDSTSSGPDNADWREESDRFKDRLEKLGTEAKKKGGELGRKINERIDKLESERKTFQNDTARSDFKEKWKAFKEKANAEIDSLNNKINSKIDNKK
jgi:hypothetical protein